MFGEVEGINDWFNVFKVGFGWCLWSEYWFGIFLEDVLGYVSFVNEVLDGEFDFFDGEWVEVFFVINGNNVWVVLVVNWVLDDVIKCWSVFVEFYVGFLFVV